MERSDYLRRLLVPFWLRPETPLWYAHEAYLVRRYLGERLRGPSLELGCMDGVSTFVMLGGEFGMDFDVYAATTWDDASHRFQSRAQDYFDTVKGVGEPIDIVRRPEDRFDVGLTWKAAHLAKAAQLGIHDELVEHDPNLGLEPFADERFATVWAPNLYWIDELAGLLGELRRVLRPEGRLLTVLPDASAPREMLYHLRDRAPAQWIDNLDRGRYGNISKQARELDEWHATFAAAGLDVLRHERFLPKPVFQFNDVGARPLFGVLLHIYELLKRSSPDDLREVKEHWIEVAFDFLAPLCDVEWMQGMPELWHIFELGQR
jgi:SAM-dependent methyltransferase